MIRLAKGLLAVGVVFAALAPADAAPQKGKGGGGGEGKGGGGGRGYGGVPPGQVRNAVLGSAFGPGYSGGFYPTPFYPNYYGNSYYPYYGPSYFGSGLWPGGFGLANLPYYRSFGGYSPYYYPDGSILPYNYAGAYSAPATAAVLGMPAVIDPALVPVNPVGSDPAVQQPIPAPTPAPTGASPVHVTVRVPDGAQVWVADAPSNQIGPAQEFVSPPVEPGVDYTYVVRATWAENGQPVSRTKRVTVRAGDRVTVDMTQPD